MTHEEFVKDWTERYVKGTCTLEHLQRLQAIGRLTEEQVRQILVEARKRDKGLI